MSSVVFKGGRLIDPASGFDGLADVAVTDGLVSEVGVGISSGSADAIDISGSVICPGFVDLHVHLREPGREDEETIASGSAAAALGGFTGICSMPNTDPVCDNTSVAEMISSQAARVGLIKIVPAASITKGLEGKTLSPIGELVRAGVRMFTDDGHGVQDASLMRRAMEYIKGFDALCAEHCEDDPLSEGGQMHEGEVSDALGLKGIPAAAEEVALARDLMLAQLTGVRFHALHVSTAGSVDLIRKAKERGIRVTAEVTPHHLALTDAEVGSYDPNFKVNPPLRASQDVEALRAGLADGTIDAIATDHAPHSAEEKESEFELAPPGMLGLETALAVILTEVVGKGVIDLPAALRLLSTSPARILGLEGHGGPVSVGVPANLTVFDPKAEWLVEPSQFASLSRNSPWSGRTLKGRVLHTIFEGRLVVRDGMLLEAVKT